MSNLTDLQTRAVAIRAKYRELEKQKYGRAWTPHEMAMGLAVDVGELLELAMSKAGIRNNEDVDERLAHELIDCLWSVLVLAHEYGVDLAQEFPKKMNELEARIAKAQT